MTPAPSMSRHATLSTALLVVGIALLVSPALVPIEPVLYHDTGRWTDDNRTEIEEQGYRIVAYENLSERGKELYLRTLEAGGEYAVPRGEGAPDFAYPTPGELGDVEDWEDRNALRVVVVERPADADLPPTDERLEIAEHRREEAIRRATETGGTPTVRSVEEMRRQIGRYDMMTTRTDRPPLSAPRSLARLGAVAAGALALGTGGYLRSQP